MKRLLTRLWLWLTRMDEPSETMTKAESDKWMDDQW